MNFLTVIWVAFFLGALLNVVSDILTHEAFKLSDMTSIKLSFFMFYSAWYSTQGAKS